MKYLCKTKHKKNNILIPGITSVIFLLSLISVVQAQTVLKWTGCGITKKAFMAEAAKAYEVATNGNIKITLSGGGATKGIRFADAAMADLGGTCRPSLPDQFPQEESKVYLTVVAWDALVPIVNEKNPIKSLTSDQLKQIVFGKITNWSDVGGPNQKIQVVARIGKITGVGFMARKIIFEDLEAEYAKDAIIVKSSGPLEKKVETMQWAVGITGISSAKRRPVKILPVDGNEASVQNIASGHYPTFRPLYLATQGKPKGENKSFLDWLLSDKGQKVVEQCGTVTLKQGAGLKSKFKHWLNTDRIVNFKDLP